MPGTLHTSDLLAVISDIEGYKANLRQAILARNIDLPSSVLLDRYPDYIKLIRDDVSIDYIENANSSQYIATGACPYRVVAKFKYGFMPSGIDTVVSSHTPYSDFYGPGSLGTQMIMGSCTNTLPIKAVSDLPNSSFGDSLLSYCNYYNVYGIWNREMYETSKSPATSVVHKNLYFGGVNPVTDYQTHTLSHYNNITNFVQGPVITSADTIYTIDATRNLSMTVNGTTYNVTSNNPYPLSSTNNVNWNIFKNGLKTGCRIYYVDFYDSSNNLIRSFRPRLTFRNGVMEPCLYDSVTDAHYFNQGTGTFIYPNYIIN